MLFKATLVAVIVYLAACYAYGLYLLVKLYANKRLHAAPAHLQENPRSISDTTPASAPQTRDGRPAYDTPAKAA